MNARPLGKGEFYLGKDTTRAAPYSGSWIIPHWHMQNVDIHHGYCGFAAGGVELTLERSVDGALRHEQADRSSDLKLMIECRIAIRHLKDLMPYKLLDGLSI